MATEHGLTVEMDDCVGLDEALKLSTEFSYHATAGEIPGSLPVPIPAPEVCEFVVRPWHQVSQEEREAFRRFYVRVGGALEDLAQSVRDGVDLDEVAWSEITAGLGLAAKL